MKEYIKHLVDSIEGYGNIVVTKPNGDTKKYPFKNTITDHFRKNMMNAILFGDTSNELDPTNRYYYSNKMLAYRFRVTVASEKKVASNTLVDNLPSISNTTSVKNGTAKQLEFDANGGLVGESRIARIGTIDTNQALITSVLGNSPYHVATGLQEELEGFDFSQQVFVGMQSIGGGQTSPLFRSARENIRWLKGSDSSWQRLAQKNDITDGYDAENGNNGQTKILNSGIDSPSAKIAYWDSYTKEEFGVQATVRQTMGASRWKVATWKLLREDKLTEVENKLKAWYVSENDVLPTITNFVHPTTQKSLLWHEGQEGIVSNNFYESNFMPGNWGEYFNENSFELSDPEGANYWAFTERKDQWTDIGNTYSYRDVDNKLVVNGQQVRQRGKLLAIEVQNFITAKDDNNVNDIPETLAFHIPTTNPIIIDRNDNITVEYNFKFTKPTSANDDSLQWNIAYIDQLARAINPVGKDISTGLNSQYVNRATPIQITGAAVFEKGILNETDSTTKVADWKKIGEDASVSAGDTNPDALGNYPPEPDTNGIYAWKDDQHYADYSEEKTIRVPAAPAKIQRKKLSWYYDRGVVEDKIIERATQELDFWRVWTSRTSDMWTEIVTDDDATLNDFTNVSYYPTNTDVSGISEYARGDRRHGTFSDGVYVHNLFKINDNTVIDRRSYNSQLEFTPCFQHMIGATVNDPTNSNYLWSIMDTDNPLNTVVGNHFDYFKHMVSDRDDNTFILSFSSNSWNMPAAENRFVAALNFDNRRCQIWVTPYGAISENILKHAALTNWIKNDNYYLPDGSTGESTDKQAMLNVDTLWQNGIRMVNSDPDTIFTTQQATAAAVNMLAPATEQVGNDTYLIKNQEVGETEFQSKIDFKVTSDSRFITPPRFFKVMYGETGHFVPRDLQDDDVISKWLLRDDHVDLISEKFGDLRHTDASAQWTKTNDELFSELYSLTIHKDEKGTKDTGVHYLYDNIRLDKTIMETIDTILSDPAAWANNTYIAAEYGGHELGPTEEPYDYNVESNPAGRKPYGSGDGWKVNDQYYIGGEAKYFTLDGTVKTIKNTVEDQNTEISLTDAQALADFNEDIHGVDKEIFVPNPETKILVFKEEKGSSTTTTISHSDILSTYIIIEGDLKVDNPRATQPDAMGNYPPNTEFNLKPGTGDLPYASTEIIIPPDTDNTPVKLHYGEHTNEKLKSTEITYTFGERKGIIPDFDPGSNILISDWQSDNAHDLRASTPVFYGGGVDDTRTLRAKETTVEGTSTVVKSWNDETGEASAALDGVAGTGIIGTGTPSEGVSPPKRWAYGDPYRFVNGEAPVVLVNGGSTENFAGSPQEHDNIVGTTIPDAENNAPPNGVWKADDGYPNPWENGYGAETFGRTNWDLIKIKLASSTRLNSASDTPWDVTLPTVDDGYSVNTFGDYYIRETVAKNNHNYTSEQIGDSFLIEYKLGAGVDKEIPINSIRGKGFLDSYDIAPGQNGSGPEGDKWTDGNKFLLLYNVKSTTPAEYIWKSEDVYAYEGTHSVTLTADRTSEFGYMGTIQEFEHNWVIGTQSQDRRFRTPDKNVFVYIDAGSNVVNPSTWANIELKERIVLEDDIGLWADKQSLSADDRMFSAIPLDDFIWTYTFSNDVAPFNLYSRFDEDGDLTSYKPLLNETGTNLKESSGKKVKLTNQNSATEQLFHSLSSEARTKYESGSGDVLKNIEMAPNVHPEIVEMYDPYAFQGYTGFGLLRSMVMKHQMINSDPTTITGWNQGDRESELRTLTKWFHPTDNPLGATLDSVYVLVKTELEKISSDAWAVNQDHKYKDEILLALIRYYAPFGMMDLYFWDDQTPDRMTLSFPDPKQDMFYGLISNPGGDDDSMSGQNQTDNPTWTQGDKVELKWTINPPITGSV